MRKICPECGHEFQGKRWEGIDAREAWLLISSGRYERQMTRAPEKLRRLAEEAQ